MACGGDALNSLDEMDEAEATFTRARAVGPTDARPSLNLGRFLTKMGRPAEAISAFYEAAAVDDFRQRCFIGTASNMCGER